MGSGGKAGGGGSSSYDYFGTVAGAICWGPAHTLQALIIDGKQVVTGPVTLSTAATDLTLDPIAGDYLDTGGRITIYRGDQTTADAALPDHPPYQGLCYIVAVGLLFGRERTAAPNIQAIVSRLPQADVSLVPSLQNVFTDLDGLGKPTIASQVNPVAVLVELLTSRHGLGLPVAALDATTWNEASDWVSNVARKSFTFCSPAFTSQEDARSAIRTLLEMMDATLYWNESGKVAVALLKPGVTPGSPITIDARHVTARHRLEAPGLADVPTATLVRYTDRAREWKEREQQAVNLVALGLRSGIAQTQSIDRPHITGADHAARHAVEMSLRASRPIGSVEVTVRRPVVAGIHPGSKVLVDIDPEPGGDGLAQLCVVEEMEESDNGPVRLTLRPDTLVTAETYSPAWTADEPQDNSCPPIDESKALAIPLPADVWPDSSIAVLATRPRVDVVGFRVYYSPDDADYADLGSQSGFAVRAALGADIDGDETEIILTLPDGDSGPDAYLAGRYPTTEAGMLADELVLVLANVVSGEVVVTDGEPEIEILSIQSRALVGSDMVYTVARGRQGSLSREWVAADASGWILPLSSIAPWQHPGLSAAVETGATGYLHLVAYTAQDTDDTTPIPEIQITMPSNADPAPIITWTTPSGSTGTTGGSGAYTPDFAVEDLQGDLVDVQMTSEDTAGNTILWGHWTLSPRRVWEYPGDAITLPAVGVYRLTVTATDRTGAKTASVRTLERVAASGGDSLPAPRFVPASGRFYSNLLITISVLTPSTRFEYQISPPGSEGPRSFGPSEVLPGGWRRVASVLSTSTTYLLTASTRVWVRAGDGTNWGGWVFSDYTRA